MDPRVHLSSLLALWGAFLHSVWLLFISERWDQHLSDDWAILASWYGGEGLRPHQSVFSPKPRAGRSNNVFDLRFMRAQSVDAWLCYCLLLFYLWEKEQRLNKVEYLQKHRARKETHRATGRSVSRKCRGYITNSSLSPPQPPRPILPSFSCLWPSWQSLQLHPRLSKSASSVSTINISDPKSSYCNCHRDGHL